MTADILYPRRPNIDGEDMPLPRECYGRDLHRTPIDVGDYDDYLALPVLDMSPWPRLMELTGWAVAWFLVWVWIWLIVFGIMGG